MSGLKSVFVSPSRVILGASIIAAFSGFAIQPAGATTITAAGTTVQGTVPTATFGNDGYKMYNEFAFGTGGAGSTTSPSHNIESPASYVASITDYPNATYYNAGATYTKIKIAGTDYDSGVIYNSGGTLATIKLNTSGLPSSFQLAVLADNENENGAGHRDQSITVSAPGSSDTQVPSGTLSTNRFYLFNISNLTPGDSITVGGIAGSDGLLVGGLVFSSVPEPASFGLVAIGLVGLLARRRSARRVAR